MNNGMLEVNLHTINDKVRFDACAPDKPAIAIDYFPPVGDGEGYTSLELLMASFASCVGTALLTLLRAMRKTVSALETEARGAQCPEHPKKLSRIDLSMVFTSPDLEEADVQKALAMAEEKYCPVWAMIKGTTEVGVTFAIKR